MKVDVPIVGDVKSVLAEMNELVAAENPKQSSALKAWWAQIDSWRSKLCLDYDNSNGLIKPQYVIQKLWEVTKGEAYVTSDVGQHQMWAAQYYKFDKPRRWICLLCTSGLFPALAVISP